VSDNDEVLRGLHIDDLIALITVLRRDYAAATVAADAAAEAVGNMADYVSQIIAERDRLQAVVDAVRVMWGDTGDDTAFTAVELALAALDVSPTMGGQTDG
jgi:hypothetical protein